MLKSLRNTARKYGSKAAVVGTSAMITVSQAMAALPTEVTTAISDAKADGLSVAGGFLAAIIVISALLVARRGAKG
jgi:hypothetical protein